LQRLWERGGSNDIQENPYESQNESVNPDAQATRSINTTEPRHLAGAHSAWKAGRSDVRTPMPNPVTTRKL
jgi:hypothetical protein